MWLLLASAHALAPMALQVVDPDGQGVPCVTLTTTHQVSLRTDQEGLAALFEPGLVGEPVWFTVDAPLHGVPADGFGYEGVTVEVTEGGYARIVVQPTGWGIAPCDATDEGRRLLERAPEAPFALEVVDSVSGRGVPLARVRSGERTWITDSAGRIAVLDPALYEVDATFEVEAWRGYRGLGAVVANVTEGGTQVLEAERLFPAERLHRVTGPDPYRDSELLGRATPTPSLQGRVAGQDSNLTVDIDGRTLWMWGDTSALDYPLGHFATAAAWVDVPAAPGEPAPLDYLVDDDGFSRGVAALSDDGPVWLTLPAVVDDGGTDAVVAVFGVFSGGLVATDRGLARWDPAAEAFEAVARLPLAPTLGHQVPVVEGGWVYAHEGVRFPATLGGASDPTQWQAFTPLVDGSILRHPDGSPDWAWRSGQPLADADRLDVDDRWVHIVDPLDGTAVEPHEGTVVHSPWRHRYLWLFTRNAGLFALGELWLAEADTPIGPWRFARKLADHDGYTTYNPMVNPVRMADDRTLAFQTTYTTFFATESEPTPRYDYNQLAYQVDLEHPDAAVPVPVYAPDGGRAPRTRPALRADLGDAPLAFHAHDRPGEGRVAIGFDAADCAGGVVTADAAEARFWVDGAQGEGQVPLWRATGDDGTVSVGLDVPEGATADPDPLGFVWPHVGTAHTPVLAHLDPTQPDLGVDRCVLAGDTLALQVDPAVRLDRTVRWSVDGVAVAEGDALAHTVTDGPQRIEVTLTDARGNTWSDTLWVHGTPATATTPPSSDPSPDPTAPATTPTAPGMPSDAAPVEEARGCGCATGAPPTGWLFLLATGAARNRRRGGSTTSPPAR